MGSIVRTCPIFPPGILRGPRAGSNIPKACEHNPGTLGRGNIGAGDRGRDPCLQLAVLVGSRLLTPPLSRTAQGGRCGRDGSSFSLLGTTLCTAAALQPHSQVVSAPVFCPVRVDTSTQASNILEEAQQLTAGGG